MTACFKYDSFLSYLITSGIVSVAFFALIMTSTILLPIQNLGKTQLIIAGVLAFICYWIGPLYGFGLEIMMELKADVFCLIVTIVDNFLIFNFPTLLQEHPRTERMLQIFILNQVTEMMLTKRILKKIEPMENEGIGIRISRASTTRFPLAQNEIIVCIGNTPIFTVDDFIAAINLLRHEGSKVRVILLK